MIVCVVYVQPYSRDELMLSSRPNIFEHTPMLHVNIMYECKMLCEKLKECGSVHGKTEVNALLIEVFDLDVWGCDRGYDARDRDH